MALTLGLGFGLVLRRRRLARVSRSGPAHAAPASAACRRLDRLPHLRRTLRAGRWPRDRLLLATQQTTSEGQSYGCSSRWSRTTARPSTGCSHWTRTNLAGNQFDAQNVRLPAWQWGKKPDGSFGVLDPNSASDSDLWIAYDLLQAGRLWHDSELYATRRGARRADRAPGNDHAAGRRPDAAARTARLQESVA